MLKAQNSGEKGLTPEIHRPAQQPHEICAQIQQEEITVYGWLLLELLWNGQ